STKIGSRPICRIARTGELTPPGSTRRARSYSSALRGVFSFPPGVVVGEVVQADLLVLGRGVERGAIVGAHPALGRDRVEDRVALLLRAAVGHGEDAVGPVLVGRPLVAVGDAAGGGHPSADLEDPLLRHLPDPHPVGGEAGPAAASPPPP